MRRKIGFRSLKMAEDRVKMRSRSRQERQDAIFDIPPAFSFDFGAVSWAILGHLSPILGHLGRLVADLARSWGKARSSSLATLSKSNALLMTTTASDLRNDIMSAAAHRDTSSS